MRSKMLGLAAFAVALVVVAGCINYDQELTLDPDGSGTVKVRYDRTGGSTGEEEGEGSLDMSGAPKLSFTEEEITAEYEGSAVTVRDIVIGETDAGVPEATYYIDFDNVTDLNGYGIFALEGDKLKQTFSLDAAGDTQVFKQLVQLKMDVEDPSQLSDYKFTYLLNAPGEVDETKTNGTVTENTVKWEYSLDKLVNADTEMTATYKAAAPGGGGKIAVIIGIILCVIIVIVIIIVIIVLLTKKKKKPAGPAPTPPSEPGQPAA